MKKKVSILFLVLTLVGTMLISGLIVPTEAKVKLRWTYMLFGGAESVKTFRQISRMFEEKNPGVEVKFEPAVGEVWDKLYTQMAARNAPDVFFSIAAGITPRKFADRGQALCLDPYIDKKFLEDFNPRQVARCKKEGHLYALPITLGPYVMYYNKKMFDEAGVGYPDKSWNWDTLLTASKKLTKKDAAGKTYQFGTQLVCELGWNLITFIWQNGGRVGEATPGETVLSKITLDEPASLEALKFQHDMIWKYHVSPTPSQLGALKKWNSFGNGLTATVISGPSDIAYESELCDFPWDISVVPKGPVQRAVASEANEWVVYQHTKYPQEAANFVKFLVSPEIEKIIFEIETRIPSLVSLQKKIAELHPYKEQVNVQAITDSYPYASINPQFEHDEKVRELLTPVLEKIFLLNKLPLEEGIKDICRRINEKVLLVTE